MTDEEFYEQHPELRPGLPMLDKPEPTEQQLVAAVMAAVIAADHASGAQHLQFGAGASRGYGKLRDALVDFGGYLALTYEALVSDDPVLRWGLWAMWERAKSEKWAAVKAAFVAVSRTLERTGQQPGIFHGKLAQRIDEIGKQMEDQAK